MVPGLLYIVAAAAAVAQVPEIGAVREADGPQLAPPVVSAPAKPRIHARSEWDPNPPAPAQKAAPARTRISIHHTESVDLDRLHLTPGSPESEAAAKDELLKILKVHRKTMGWPDVAYHYIVDWEGRVWEGRAPASAGLSVAIMGNWGRRPRDAAETDLRAKQLESLEALLAWLSHDDHIRPQNILGHSEYEETICPGAYLTKPLREIRRRLLASLAPPPAVQAKRDAPKLKKQGVGGAATGLGAAHAAGNLDHAFDNSLAKPPSYFEVPADPNLAHPAGSAPTAPPTAPRAPDPASLDNGKYLVPFQSQEWPGVRPGGGWHARRDYGGHTGLDLQADEGTPVMASRPGRVIFVDTKYTARYMKTRAGHSGYGNRVIVEHPDGTETWYCHLESGSVAVKVGDVVTHDTQLGRVGDTGHSFGPHLHFMVIDKDGDPTNPAVALGHTPPAKPKPRYAKAPTAPKAYNAP